MRIVIIFDTFDVFPIEHVKIFLPAKQEGDFLIIGIYTDDLNKRKSPPVYDFASQMEIIYSLRFVEESLDFKRQRVIEEIRDISS